VPFVSILFIFFLISWQGIKPGETVRTSFSRLTSVKAIIAIFHIFRVVLNHHHDINLNQVHLQKSKYEKFKAACLMCFIV
jgi:hypothetical protein